MKVRPLVVRGAESWQFLAFVFTAAVVLELSWISQIEIPSVWKIPSVWISLAADTLLFVGTFYTVMRNGRVRNWLLGRPRKWIKEER